MSALAWISGSLLVGAMGASTFAGLRGAHGGLASLFSRYASMIEDDASFLLLRHSGSRIARLQLVAVGFSFVMLLFTGRLILLGCAVGVLLGPPLILKRRRAGRVARLERQLDTWLLMLANALKSTSSLGEAIESTAVLVPRPFSEEVDLLVKELRLGVPLDRALDAMSLRIGSPSISGALMMIVVARQTGGSLPSTLETSASALREAARLEGVLRTKTAEGRGQVLVLALVPFLLCLIITWLDPRWFEPMVEHHYGRLVLAVCLVAWTAATAWAHQIAGAEL